MRTSRNGCMPRSITRRSRITLTTLLLLALPTLVNFRNVDSPSGVIFKTNPLHCRSREH